MIAARASLAAAMAAGGAAPSAAAIEPMAGPGGAQHANPARVVHSPGASSSTSSGYSIPASIVMCESGGNYRAVNPSTGAGGAYQILPSTWAAYGGTGPPQNAPPAEQNAIAAKIYASAGPGAWSCS